jgi:putative ABC transport system permease protein
LEIAVTLTLAYVSGLLIHSLIIAQNADPGFFPDRLLKMELVLPPSSYPSPARQQQFFAHLMEQMRRMPGVTEVGGVNCAPSAGDCGDWFYSVADQPSPPRGDVPVSLFNTAEPGYFAAMHIPIKQGRVFTDQDQTASAQVAIINEVLARKWWPGASPIGQRIKVGGPYIEGPMLQVVGVAGNVSQMGLDSEPMEEIYQPFAQRTQPALTLMIRGREKPEDLMPQVRRVVFADDANLAIEHLGPFDEALQGTLARRKFSTALLGAFAGLAVLLASVGIYGLLTYWVAVREAEIAIRMALGAPGWWIARWTGAEALRLAAVGILLGTAGGLAASRLVESMVFGVPPQSIATIVVSALAVAGLVMVSAAIPVWRAMRVDVIGHLHRT